jgi:hypothetical protein
MDPRAHGSHGCVLLHSSSLSPSLPVCFCGSDALNYTWHIKVLSLFLLLRIIVFLSQEFIFVLLLEELSQGERGLIT